MSQTAKTVAHQASFLMIASTLQKAISFFAFTYAARVLGAEGVGTYFYVLSMSSLAAAWTDLGMTPVIIRAFATSEKEGWGLVLLAVRAKLVLIPLAAIGAILYLWQSVHGWAMLPFLGLALVVMAEDALSLLGYGILRGRQRLDIESSGMVLGQLLSSGGLVLAIALGFGVTGALVALMIGSLWHVIWSVAWVVRVCRIPQGLPQETWRRFVRLAYPFAFAGIFVRIYSSIDSLLINHWNGTSAVGQYAVAYKLTYALQFLPMAFVAALYPALSAAHAKNDETSLTHTVLGSWRFMALLGFPLAAGLSGFAPRLLPRLYGVHFSPAIDVLAVLSWVLLPIFLDFPIGSYLNATHRAEQKTFAMGMTMVVNVIANAVLVPRWGPVGAAWSALGSFFVLLLVGAWFARRIFLSKTALEVVVKAILCAAGLWGVIRFALGLLPFVPALALAPVVAILLAFLTGLLTREDVTTLKTLVLERRARV